MGWAVMKVADITHAATKREGHFRVALWLNSCHGEVTIAKVRAKFPEVDRATAYRILADWRNARGISA